MHQIYDTTRDPSASSYAFTVLEIITFKLPYLPPSVYTTHVKVWKNGNLVEIYEVNGDGRLNSKRNMVEEIVFNSSRNARGDKGLSKTKHGHMKSFVGEPPIMNELRMLSEAVYKPHAVQIRTSPHMQ